MADPVPQHVVVRVTTLFDLCVERLHALGIPFSEHSTLPGGSLGRSNGREIQMKSGLSPVIRLYVLFHEVAHHYLHRVQYGMPAVTDDEAEYEAHWAARKLFVRYGLGEQIPLSWDMGTAANRELVDQLGAEYLQRRIDVTVGLVAALMEPSIRKFDILT